MSTELGFKNKRVVITGGASGMGASAVRAFAAEGAKVFAVDLNGDQLDTVVSEVGDLATGHVADLSQQGDVEALVAAAVERLGGIDILINNAGIGALGRAADLAPETWRRVMAVDLDAVFYASRKALPHLIASRGCIVNTASISGVNADYGMTAYSSAKAGVLGLTRVLALDYARHGVRVNAVSPGLIDTPMTNGLPRALLDQFTARIPMGRAGLAQEIVDAMLFLASGKASYITGQNLIVDGGLLAHTGQPNLLSALSG